MFTGARTTPSRSHTLRYVLKNRKTGECYLAVCFTLHLKDDVDEDGTIREGDPIGESEGHDAKPDGQPSQKPGEVAAETSADDLD